MIREFPVDFALIDAIWSSDGLVGAKSSRSPKHTKTLIAGRDMVAVDWVGAELMGLDPMCSFFMQEAVQAFGKPEIERRGDMTPYANWENIPRHLDKLIRVGENWYGFSNWVGFISTDMDKKFPLKVDSNMKKAIRDLNLGVSKKLANLKRDEAPEEVIWVVSDVHLGSLDSNHREFAEFLEWAAKGGKFKIEGDKRRVKAPDKIIILGDFLELWNPAEKDFKNVALQLFEGLNALFSIAEEIIYVTGNHDEALEAYGANYPITDPRFSIHSRHYPDSEPRYLTLGGLRYFFLHGHQFDKLFIWLGPLSKTPSLMAELNNTLQRFVPLKGWALPLLLLITALLNAVYRALPLWIPAVIGALSIPRVFTYLQGPFWKIFGRYLANRPKHKDISELISKGYYDPKKDTMTADVVVYGHTHYPEISHPEVSKRLGKTLVNSGSWTGDSKATEKNTFVVIDKQGFMLLKWNGKDKELSLLDSHLNRKI